MRPVLLTPLSLYLVAQGVMADSLDAPAIPSVLTATRLSQPIDEAPASVTVITAQDIRSHGFRTIPEALALVPGMVIAHASGHGVNVSYHGYTGTIPRRMQVLLDGMVFYRSGEARVEWALLPVSMESIARIEVVRGPSAAAYGANAVLAVVNIITKSPAETQGARAAVRLGDGVKDAGVMAGWAGGSGHFRVNAFSRSDTGRGHLRDDTTVQVINGAYQGKLSDTVTLEARLGAAATEREKQFIHPTQTPDSKPDLTEDEMLGSVRLTHDLSPTHTMEWALYGVHDDQRQGWTSCVPAFTLMPQLAALYDANPAYARDAVSGRRPSGGSAQDAALFMAVLAEARRLGPALAGNICGDTDQDFTEAHYHAAWQDTYVFSEDLRVVGGLEYQQNDSYSRTYLGGREENEVARAFVNGEYRMGRALLNVGGMLEHGSLVDDEFMPRVGITYRLTPSQTLRAIYTKAARTPDTFETAVDWRYSLDHLTRNPFNDAEQLRYYQTTKAPGGLGSEHIRSYELGWHLEPMLRNYGFDVRLYRDSLTDVISERLAFGNFTPGNDSAYRQQGAELTASWVLDERFTLFSTYAYQDHDQKRGTEPAVYPTHSGQLGLQMKLDNGVYGAVRAVTQSELNGVTPQYVDSAVRQTASALSLDDAQNYVEMNLGKSGISVLGKELTLSTFVRYRTSDDAFALPSNPGSERTTAWVTVKAAL